MSEWASKFSSRNQRMLGDEKKGDSKRNQMMQNLFNDQSKNEEEDVDVDVDYEDNLITNLYTCIYI